MRACCGKIHCVQCTGHASGQGGSQLGDSAVGANDHWDMFSDIILGLADMLKVSTAWHISPLSLNFYLAIQPSTHFLLSEFLRRGLHQTMWRLWVQLFMECLSEEALVLNLSKGHMFDCKESGAVA